MKDRIAETVRENMHDDPVITLNMFITDPKSVRYEERVKDLAVATFVGCAPLVGLPPELYETESGKGWSDFIMNYNLP